MRDVLDYMNGDPESRWEDAQDFMELAEDFEEDEIFGEAGGEHPLAGGVERCRCYACRGAPLAGAQTLCWHENPEDRRLRCHRVPGHRGRCSVLLSDRETLVEWWSLGA